MNKCNVSEWVWIFKRQETITVANTRYERLWTVISVEVKEQIEERVRTNGISFDEIEGNVLKKQHLETFFVIETESCISLNDKIPLIEKIY